MDTETLDRLNELKSRLDGMERRMAQQDNLIDKLQNELIKAGRYENNSLDLQLAGVQYLLKRAGEVKGREKGRRR